MQKILLVSIRKSHVFSDILVEPIDVEDVSFYAEDTLSIDSIQNAVSWLSGNIFIGPTNRGTFGPTFQRTGEELLEAFDQNAEPIVG